MHPGKITEHDVDRLGRIAGWSYCQYHNYKVLFEGYRGNKPKYGNIAPDALGSLASALKEHVVVQVHKLLDPPTDHRGNENLSIRFFVQHAEFAQPPVRRELERLAKELESFGTKLRPARDKIISHFDIIATRDGSALGRAKTEEWKRYWPNLKKFCRFIISGILWYEPKHPGCDGDYGCCGSPWNFRGKSRYARHSSSSPIAA